MRLDREAVVAMQRTVTRAMRLLLYGRPFAPGSPLAPAAVPLTWLIWSVVVAFGAGRGGLHRVGRGVRGVGRGVLWAAEAAWRWYVGGFVRIALASLWTAKLVLARVGLLAAVVAFGLLCWAAFRVDVTVGVAAVGVALLLLASDAFWDVLQYKIGERRGGSR